MQAMKELKTWCDAEKGRYMQLARHLQRVPSFVTKMANGEKPVPLDLCGPIEAHTGIPCEVLRPDQVEHFAYMRTRPVVGFDVVDIPKDAVACLESTKYEVINAIEATDPILKAA